MEDLDENARPRFSHTLPLEPAQWLFCDVHEAIQAHPIEYHDIDSMPVIECQRVAYHASRNLSSGDYSYMPPHPILFEEFHQCIFSL